MILINDKPVTQYDIYDECVKRNIPCHNHASDLYIPVTVETEALVKHYKLRHECFQNRVEGGPWYDLPFQYKPWWTSKDKQGENHET